MKRYGLLEEERLLTCKDLQYILNVGRGKAYELLKSDCFPTICINNRMYVSVKNLRRWLCTYTGKTYVL